MTITCSLDKNDYENRKGDKLIVRIPPGQKDGDPAPKPVKPAAYLWVPRHRPDKSWRDEHSIN